jgi:cell division protein FtsW
MIKPSSQKIKGDKVIWVMIILLYLISIVAIYSSVGSTGDFMMPLLKQIVLVVVSFAAIYVSHRIPIGWYRRLAVPGLVVCIILLILVQFIGKQDHGATRVFPLLGYTFNPTDLVKIGLILYLAKIMESKTLDTFKEFAWKILAPSAVVFILVLLGSTSAALLILTAVMIVLLVGEIKAAFLFKSAMIAIVFFGLYFADGATTNILPRSKTAVSRITNFLSPKDDANAKNEQLDYSKMAIASGGLTGKGPGHSSQRYVLSQSSSDFIYAIIIEEYGFIGGAFILIIYLILLFRAVVIARSCTRVFPMIITLGLVLSIVFQAMLNMCVAVGIVPVTGQPLPIVSLGGSSLLTISISLGIVLAVSRATEERNIIEKNTTAQGK